MKWAAPGSKRIVEIGFGYSIQWGGVPVSKGWSAFRFGRVFLLEKAFWFDYVA